MWNSAAKVSCFMQVAKNDMIRGFCVWFFSYGFKTQVNIWSGSIVVSIRQAQLKTSSDEQIDKLRRTCEQYTIEHRTGDVTIGI